MNPTNGAELLDSIAAFIGRFVALKEGEAQVIALWAAHSYCMDAAEATPYLSVTSAVKQCGKTRLLEALEILVPKPWLTGRVTAACLIRKIDAQKPTLLLDESDAAFNGDKDYAEALRGVLNTGHRRGGQASCCVGQGANIAFKDFQTFCPKVIAGIGKLPDTVADRSIPIRLKRRSRNERSERFRRRLLESEAKGIRDQICCWATANLETLKSSEPELPQQLSDRQMDGAEPLLAIADLAGRDWPTKSRRALSEILAGTAAEDDSIAARLLADIRAILDAKAERKEADADKIRSAELCDALARIEESPWPEYRSGKPISQAKLAELLKPFEIKSRGIRIGTSTPKGYVREQFEDAWSRYLRPSTNAVAPDTSHKPQRPQQSNIHAGAKHFLEPQQSVSVAASKSEESAIKAGIVADVADMGPPAKMIEVEI